MCSIQRLISKQLTSTSNFAQCIYGQSTAVHAITDAREYNCSIESAPKTIP